MITRIHGYLVRIGVKFMQCYRCYKHMNETINNPLHITDYGLMLNAGVFKEVIWAIVHFPSRYEAEGWIRTDKETK